MAVLCVIKEFFRKRVVALKRKPQVLPLLFIIISCMVYTFNLSNYSNAAIYASDSWVAILVFLTTLLSILSIFTYLGAFDRKRIKYMMVVLAMLLLLALSVFDVMCYNSISGRIKEGSERVELIQAISDLKVHLVFLVLSIILVATRPLYHKLLLRINTSIPDNEFDAEMQAANESVVEDDE